MEKEKIYGMRFGDVYPLLVNKAVRKGRTAQEVDTVIGWLTGYSAAQIAEAVSSGLTYEMFFERAPQKNPGRKEIRGTVCGVRVEEIEDPLMREIRCLDKLVDELAKGKPMKKILRQG